MQKGQDIDGKIADDWAGFSISMPDSKTIAIGAPSDDTVNPRHVYIYSWNGSSWIQKGGDITGMIWNEEFGYSVSMPDTNTVGVGARIGNGGSGYAAINLESIVLYY